MPRNSPTPRPRPAAEGPRPLLFVDDSGGGLAALGAAVARSLGHGDAAAASTAPPRLPPEIAGVIEEVGMKVPEVGRFHAAESASAEVIYLGPAAPPAALRGVTAWTAALFDGEGDLERRATARIARDRLERRLAAHGTR